MTRRGPALLIATLLLTACSSETSALSPQGPGADIIARLFWLFFAVALGVWLLVCSGMIFALLRRRPAEAHPLLPGEDAEARPRIVIYGLTVVTGLILMALATLSFFAGRSLAGLGGEDPMEIEITGQQWWWKVRYPDANPSRTLTTANDIHVPAGRPIRLVLQSRDVIHSFWIPEITGKRDLIPGQVNTLDFIVSAPGEYRGQCAEFCGFQHAHMRLVLIADTPADFARWYARQMETPPPPITQEAAAGQQVFLTKGCVMCHRVAGTPAQAQLGPDLTHVASRKGIAANTLPMTRGALAAWIADPQGVKPGTNMPRVDLSADELNRVVAYLEQLK